MKKLTRRELKNFAESLCQSLEEVADKIGTIEAIINGGDTEDDYVEEEPVVEDDDDVPAEDDYVEEPAVPETEVEAENFSEKESNRYASVKAFLNLE